MQRQTAVTTCLKSKQLLLFALDHYFAVQSQIRVISYLKSTMLLVFAFARQNNAHNQTSSHTKNI